ncbi:hypothetical protein ABLN86_11560, partial [Mycobacterium tuberculosis]
LRSVIEIWVFNQVYLANTTGFAFIIFNAFAFFMRMRTIADLRDYIAHGRTFPNQRANAGP